MDAAPLLRSLVTRGDVSQVPGHVSAWLEQCVATCGPRDVHIMTGSGEEAAQLKRMLVRQHVMIPLPKYDNCFLVRWDNDSDNGNDNGNDNDKTISITMTMTCRTDPRDVARSEGRTFLCTAERLDSVPTPEGVKGQLGNWMHPDQLQASDSDNSNNKFALLWGEAQKKIAYCYPKVT